MAKKIGDLLKDWRIVLWLLAVAVSIFLILGQGLSSDGFPNGLNYGMDFVGGVEIHLALDKPLGTEDMTTEVGILMDRLNGMGLKDIPVRSWGDQHILVQVATSTVSEGGGIKPAQIQGIVDILKRPAKFEERIDGDLLVYGDEIYVDPQLPGGTIVSGPGGTYEWIISIKHRGAGPSSFGEVAHNRQGHLIDVFIDRPENTSVLMTNYTYSVLSNLVEKNNKAQFYQTLGSGRYSGLTTITIRAQMPVVVIENDTNETLNKLIELKKSGFTHVIFADDNTRISDDIRNTVEEAGLSTRRIEHKPNQHYAEWIQEITNLKNSLTLLFNPTGDVLGAQISGVANTAEEAQQEKQQNLIWISSGNLPAKAEIGSLSVISPTLGMNFLKYSVLMGLIAVIAVVLVVFVRYRKPVISIPIIIISMSEIIIILGFAALIRWDLDLPAIAGIIAAIGTGIDNQIVITDEIIGKRKKEEIVSFIERIKKAFFIIYTSSAIIIAVMLPLVTIGAGMIKGFAFTTIMGVLIGVLIARPAYGRIIAFLMEREE